MWVKFVPIGEGRKGVIVRGEGRGREERREFCEAGWCTDGVDGLTGYKQ